MSEETKNVGLGPEDVCAILQRRARQLDRVLEVLNFDPNAVVMHVDGMLHVALALKHMVSEANESAEAKAN